MFDSEERTGKTGTLTFRPNPSLTMRGTVQYDGDDELTVLIEGAKYEMQFDVEHDWQFEADEEPIELPKGYGALITMRDTSVGPDVFVLFKSGWRRFASTGRPIEYLPEGFIENTLRQGDFEVVFEGVGA